MANNPVILNSTNAGTQTKSANSGNTESKITQGSHGFSVLDCVRHDGTQWTKARADSQQTVAHGVVVEVIDTDTFILSITGRYVVEGHGLVVNSWYFLSDDTFGGITNVEPGISQPIVFAEDADKIVVYPYRASASSITPEGQVTTEHADLIGLDEDDHPQYLNQLRGEALFYTQNYLDSALDSKSDDGHTHTEADITDLQAYLLDAPADGASYNRRDGAWVEAGAGGLEDAPSDGKQYVREDGAWAEIDSSGIASGSGAKPDKGQYYVKANGTGDFLTLNEAMTYLNAHPVGRDDNWGYIDIYLEPGEDQDIDEIIHSGSYVLAIRRNGAGNAPKVASSGGYLYFQGAGFGSKILFRDVTVGDGATDIDLYDITVEIGWGDANFWLGASNVLYASNAKFIFTADGYPSMAEAYLEHCEVWAANNLNLRNGTNSFYGCRLHIADTLQVDNGAQMLLEGTQCFCKTFQASNPATGYPIDSFSNFFQLQAGTLELGASTGTSGWCNGVTINTLGAKVIMGEQV